MKAAIFVPLFAMVAPATAAPNIIYREAGTVIAPSGSSSHLRLGYSFESGFYRDFISDAFPQMGYSIEHETRRYRFDLVLSQPFATGQMVVQDDYRDNDYTYGCITGVGQCQYLGGDDFSFPRRSWFPSADLYYNFSFDVFPNSITYCRFCSQPGLSVENWNTFFAADMQFATADSVAYDFWVTRLPEPETWAMLVGGFGLAGISMRRRHLRPVPRV